MKAVALLLVLVAAGCVQALTYEDVTAAEFESFKVEYEKSYEIEGEEQLRKQIFMDNKKLIDSHNKRYENGEETYTMAVNQFTDLLSSEFKELMFSNLNLTEFAEGIEYADIPENVEMPSQVDWRARGAVTRVKDQKRCKSCWSFAATGVLEGQHFIKTRQLIPLSEQNLIDCSTRYRNHGCQGGNPAAALFYVRDNHGLDTERAYPYKAVDGACHFLPSAVGATVQGVTRVTPDEHILAATIALKGPISVVVDANPIQHYGGGVFSDPACQAKPGHAVLAVGYGHDQRGGDFWLVKNSWGKNWGEHGYFRLARNRGNMCKITSFAIYPIV